MLNLKKFFNVGLRNFSTIPWHLLQAVRHIFPLDYYFLKGRSFFPNIVTILVTKRCNFNCLGCSSASPQYTRENKQALQQEMSLGQIKNLIDEVSFFKPSIYINGGEPTLRPEFLEIISYAKRKKLITAFTTNGSLMTKDLAQEIVASGLDFYSTSIDGPNEYHNQRRGFDGAYERAVEGIRHLLGARQKLDKKRPHIRIACIVDAKNIAHSWHILELANKLKVDEVAFGNLMFYTRKIKEAQKVFIENYGAGGEEMLGLEIEEGEWLKVNLDDVKKFYQTARQKSDIPVFFVLSETNLDNFYSVEPPLLSRCLTPWFVATVQPNGDLTPCQGLVVGNIQKNKFLDIWNNEAMKKFRFARKKYQMPACFRCIEGQKIEFD